MTRRAAAVSLVMGCIVAMLASSGGSFGSVSDVRVISVATTADVVNGDVSTVAGLLGNPGADGVSLLEAIAATNNDPGTYSIEFAPALKGETISVSRQMRDVPAFVLTGGGVSIDGDINDDGRPDVTIAGAVPARRCQDRLIGIVVASSGNRLHALILRGFRTGVSLGGPDHTPQTFAHTEISNLDVKACTGGIVSYPASLDRWLDTQISGNTVESGTDAISFVIGGTGVLLQGLTISGNRVHVASADIRTGVAGFDINLESGAPATAGNNRIDGVVIADNTATGNGEGGIRVDAGGRSSTVEGVRVTGNHVNVWPPSNPHFMRGAILVMAGDTDPDRAAGIYASDNVTRDVVVSDNTLRGGWGVELHAGCCGASGDTMHDIHVLRNTISTVSTGGSSQDGAMLLAGAHGFASGRPATGNRMYRVWVVANRITIAGKGSRPGIQVAGGHFGKATQNTVKCVHLSKNHITGTNQPVRVDDNSGGAWGNHASLAGC